MGVGGDRRWACGRNTGVERVRMWAWLYFVTGVVGDETGVMVPFGTARCGVMWYGVVWHGAVWCGAVQCGVVWCGVMRCGVVRCGTVR